MKGFDFLNSLAVGLGSAPIPPSPAFVPAEPADVGPLPTELGVTPYPGVVQTPLGPRNDLLALQQAFPNIPIIPYPVSVVGVLLAANVAQEIAFPSGTCLFRLHGAGNWFASLQGNAEIVSAGNVGASKSVYKPDHTYFFTMASSISVISPDANTYVQAMCWTPSQLPAYR